VVVNVVRQLEGQKEIRWTQEPAVSLLWDVAALNRYMTLLLAGLLEWHERMGTLAGRESFLNQRRCLVWEGLDSTAIYIISSYIKTLQPEKALLAIVMQLCVTILGVT